MHALSAMLASFASFAEMMCRVGGDLSSPTEADGASPGKGARRPRWRLASANLEAALQLRLKGAVAARHATRVLGARRACAFVCAAQ